MIARSDIELDESDCQQLWATIQFLIANRQAQPSLAELSVETGFNELRLQNLFSDWAGVSPRQFLGYLSAEHVRTLLEERIPSVSSSVHSSRDDVCWNHLPVRWESVSPAEYKNGKVSAQIEYGFYQSQWGRCLLARTQRGLCKLAFFDDEEQGKSQLEQLRAEWPRSNPTLRQEATDDMFEQIFHFNRQTNKPLMLVLKGTPFRLKVWEAMLRIPQGHLTSYQEIAVLLGAPTASRAVGSAVGANSIGLVVPCHRVIRSSGIIGEYRWGVERKEALLGWEQSRRWSPGS